MPGIAWQRREAPGCFRGAQGASRPGPRNRARGPRNPGRQGYLARVAGPGAKRRGARAGAGRGGGVEGGSVSTGPAPWALLTWGATRNQTGVKLLARSAISITVGRGCGDNSTVANTRRTGPLLSSLGLRSNIAVTGELFGDRLSCWLLRRTALDSPVSWWLCRLNCRRAELSAGGLAGTNRLLTTHAGLARI